MKSIKTLALAIALLCSTASFAGKTAKYVFMFIGDGMGVNEVLAAQMYQAALEDRNGIVPLCFTQFPVSGLSLTYSASSGVTDSAAGGTALSCGEKTANNVIAMLPDRKTPLTSIAERAHAQGKRVAICTTVGVDHATPAVFYAHNENRNNYHQIGMELGESGFEFFAGSDFHQNFDRRNPSADEGNYANAEKNGYTIVRGYEEYKAAAAGADRMILLEPQDDDPTALPQSISQKEGDLNLAQITEAAIDFMMKERDKGFFIMVEGGQIDGALHANDPAACVREVLDMDNAVKVAYDFYLKHKNETLIVITADHETGGLSLARDNQYRLNLKALQNQTIDKGAFSSRLRKMNVDLGEEAPITWEELQEELKKSFGFWDKVRISKQQEDRLRNAYVETFGMNYVEEGSNPADNYKVEKISDLACAIMSEIALVNWGSTGHSAGYVPVFAIGKGAEQFSGQMENTEIPRRIASIAGYKW